MMSRFYIILLIVFLSSCEQTPYENLDFQLVWSDEFNSDDLQSNWNHEIGDGCEYGIQFWGNFEKQFYLEENAYIEDTALVIKSQLTNFIYDDCFGNPQTAKAFSARINSENKFDFTYGKVEASIKMDRAQGLWHAFWMLPSNPVLPWPISGEIDVLEYYRNSNGDNIVHNVHFKGPQAGYSNFIGAPFNIDNANSFFNDFHTYSLEWDQANIRCFVDGIQTLHVKKADHIELQNNWPFDEPFHLIFNTAIGGNLGGDINFFGDKEMKVDYVRVYQKTLPQ